MALLSIRSVAKQFGPVQVLRDVSMEIAAGEFLTVLGESGSGKTTLLRLLAGFERPDGGEIWMDGERLDPLPPNKRGVNTVFQHYALFPHLTVSENVAYGLRARKTPKEEIAPRVEKALAQVKMSEYAARRPMQLSGGQQQRVALARAIVRSPRLFLLDEPLSNLDAKLRVQTRTEVKQLQRALGVTTIYVTHDQEEAMSLSDRMAIFVDGRIVQIGTPEEVFAKPVSTAVAGFLGSPPMNLLPARLRGAVLEIEGHRLALPRPAGKEDRAVVAGIRPGDITIGGSGLAATVELAEPQGESVIVDLRLGNAALKARIFSGLRFREGQEVQIGIDPTRVHLFDADGRRFADRWA